MQAYVYGAKLGASELAAMLGRTEMSVTLAGQAYRLQERFDREFWIDDLSTYGLALDGTKKLCRVRASNAGHCLFAGIATPEHARLVSETLLSNDFFSGWGIRTVASSEARFNPMSYHNGSIWPHDNAIIACGFARYGFKKAALKILTGLFDASLFLDLHRMPELFCGFPRRPGESPTLYPVACAPQAWSSGSIFMLLQAALGLTINAPTAEVVFSYPLLPEFLREVRIKNLQVGKDYVDLIVHRHAQDIGLEVVRGEDNVKFLVIQ
jgi:glycogen debranching enzyme